MHTLHEIATVTSKGQITLPRSIRQALGLGVGEKVAFDLHGTEVIVTRVGSEKHEDPAIGAFLSLLEDDIKTGRHLTSLPDDLARDMLTHRQTGVPDENIVGEVAL